MDLFTVIIYVGGHWKRWGGAFIYSFISVTRDIMDILFTFCCFLTIFFMYTVNKLSSEIKEVNRNSDLLFYPELSCLLF